MNCIIACDEIQFPTHLRAELVAKTFRLEINTLNVKRSGQPKTIQTAIDKKIVLVKKKYNWWSRNYRIRLLIMGIIVTGFGVFQLSTIFTFKSNLTQIKGTLQAANIYTKNVTDSRGHESRKSELIFYLNEQQKKFYIAENIGDKWHNEKYDRILRRLKRADTITVWIKKSELNLYEPKVFQIDKDSKTMLEFETVRTEHLPLTIFLLFLGLGSIGIFIYSTFLKDSEL